MIRIADPICMPDDDMFAFTGRAVDDRAALQANQQRHFDATVAHWLSEEPIAHRAGDQNLFPYVPTAPPLGSGQE